jgi:NAD(P)-dependent dehydrogenase (short-subunit alcohol dehydrogenase family)
MVAPVLIPRPATEPQTAPPGGGWCGGLLSAATRYILKDNAMKSSFRYAMVLLVAGLLAAPSDYGFAQEQKSILVTGASSGIGRHLAETLASAGHHVYAGARKDEDLEKLGAIENITAVRLDVTRQDQVDAAVALIAEKGTGLYGLVNNAGVGGGGEVVSTPIEDQRFVYDVNVEGVYRTTQAFAPLVMESNGRIVTTGSIAGTIASFPGFSAYAGSKHWIEAFTDSLAAEMTPAGVSVSVIEPGNYQSNIRRSTVARRLDKVRAAGAEVSEEMKQAYEATVKRELSYKEPDEVTAAFMHALFDEQPLRRYMVVPNEEEHQRTILTKVNELVQLNRWGPYSYSRDDLVRLLDEALAGDGKDE